MMCVRMEALDVEPIDPERYYSVEAIAERLDVPPATIREWLRPHKKTGAVRLEGLKVGPRQWRVKGSVLQDFLEQGQPAA